MAHAELHIVWCQSGGGGGLGGACELRTEGGARGGWAVGLARCLTWTPWETRGAHSGVTVAVMAEEGTFWESNTRAAEDQLVLGLYPQEVSARVGCPCRCLQGRLCGAVLWYYDMWSYFFYGKNQKCR